MYAVIIRSDEFSDSWDEIPTLINSVCRGKLFATHDEAVLAIRQDIADEVSCSEGDLKIIKPWDGKAALVENRGKHWLYTVQEFEPIGMYSVVAVHNDDEGISVDKWDFLTLVEAIEFQQWALKERLDENDGEGYIEGDTYYDNIGAVSTYTIKCPKMGEVGQWR